jgi:hypothetical protein
MLKELGYNEYGTEEMYCGMTGRKMKAQVFIGPVYYLRLKHMVKDKLHGRSTGPRQAITRQPMELRSKDGGLKIGSHFAEKSVLQLLASPSIAGNILKLRETPVKIKKLSLLFINNIRKYIYGN